MRAISQGHDGYYWKTDDPDPLWFNEVEGRDAAPTYVKCVNLHDHLNRGESTPVPIEGMTLLATGRFEEGKRSWTGSSHKFNIYESGPQYNSRGIVILRWCGTGMSGYLLSQLWSVEAWRKLCQVLDADELWCLCHELTDAYYEARCAERKVMSQAFVDGTLKKRRRNGSVTVYVEAKAS